ncbi:hypothetical protein [Lentibacillus daqui]|uniref:hypothetical protein n=1 Tax=Lentibacillus daqui TaxID=2911514 RepID=UPI0022B14ACB|nr:hypothetical protein [Lentibacillus daqui]
MLEIGGIWPNVASTYEREYQSIMLGYQPQIGGINQMSSYINRKWQHINPMGTDINRIDRNINQIEESINRMWRNIDQTGVVIKQVNQPPHL